MCHIIILGPGGYNTTWCSRLVFISYISYIVAILKLLASFCHSNNVVFGPIYIIFRGFLEYSGPKAGDREMVTGSEVFLW